MKQQQISKLNSKAFFNNVLFHELSHSLGPAYVGNDENNGEVRAALGSSYSGLEEAKADVMGIYNILFMIQKELIPEDMRHKVQLLCKDASTSPPSPDTLHLHIRPVPQHQVWCERGPWEGGRSSAQQIP